MVTATLNIQNTPDFLLVRLSRKGDVGGFHSFMTAILCFGLLFFVVFIYKSLVADGVIIIQVLFVFLGAYGLFSVHRQLRGLWLFHAGQDTVEVKEGLFKFSSIYGIWHRRLVIRVADIQGVELVENPYQSLTAVKGWRPETITKVTIVKWQNKTQCILGQFLGAEESTALHAVLSDRLKPLMQIAG